MTLEAEYVSEIINDTSNDNGWPCKVTEAEWASNGKFVDALNQGDVIKYHYRAEDAGTYHVVVTYRSGSNTNALAWSEESGKIESGTVSAGANDSATATHTAEFDLVVTEAGDGVLVFTGPAGKSPQLDKFEMTFVSEPEPEPADKTQLNAAISAAEALNAEDYTEASWTAMQEALDAAHAVAADEEATQEAVDSAAQALNAAIGALEEISDVPAASEAAVQALRSMVEKAVALGSDDETLNAAIEAAQAVLTKETPTATEVVTALLDLSEAMQALNTDESTDALRADVQATIDFINENILNNAEGLRPGKVDALEAAVEAAQKLVDDPDATADELKTANKAMTKAAQELWEIVSKAELSALIEAANGYLDGDYTAESLEALQAAITAAQAVAGNDDATTAEVTQAITDLSDAIAGLRAEATLNKDALAHEITLVAQMVANLDDYVASTVEGLADKLAAAQEVYANATTQEEIDAATQSLLEARLNARTKADKTALEAAIAAADALDLSSYARADAEKVSTALETAKLVLSDEAATQEEVDAAANALNEAIGALDTEGADTNAPAVGADDGQDDGSGDAATADTAAAVQTGLFAGIVIIAAAAVIIMIVVRRKHNKKA